MNNNPIKIVRGIAWFFLITGSLSTFFALGQMMASIQDGHIKGILINLALNLPLIISILILVFLHPQPTIESGQTSIPVKKAPAMIAKVLLVLFLGFIATMLLFIIAMGAKF
ncbi:MAG: hypothetical protein AAB610_00295 [Patescibacteria group bacterium]